MKRLVTETEVRALDGRAPIVVDGETVITPAALDLAHERGIAVVYAGVRGGTAADVVPGARAVAREPGGLTIRVPGEGSFLVRVEAGRTQVFRVTASGLEPLIEETK